jgi:hypothetical protein
MIRGLYASLQTVSMGLYQLPVIDQNVLGNSSKETALLNGMLAGQFNSISVYDLPTILSSPSLSQSLSNFIGTAKGYGISEFNSIVASTQNCDLVKAYQAKYPNKFSGIISEFEFCNMPGTFSQYITLLQYMRTTGLKVCTYVGWFDREPSMTADQVALAIATNVDRALVHCYVKDPNTAFAYSQSRLTNFVHANKPIEIVPIFSLEAVGESVGTDTFMGDWMKLNSFAKAEFIYSSAYNPVFGSSVLKFKGFQYFESAFMPLSICIKATS